MCFLIPTMSEERDSLTRDLPWLSGESICVSSSGSLNANAAEKSFRFASWTTGSIFLMLSLLVSQGKTRPWSVQVSQIRSGNASVWKTAHEPVKNEDGEDQVNKIDTTRRQLLLRTYLASYPDCAKSDPKANQDQATISGNTWPLSIQNWFNIVAKLQDLTRMHQVTDRGWGGIRLVVEATWQDSRQVDSHHFSSLSGPRSSNRLHCFIQWV